ncbi:MAG: threonine synthase [Bacteroidota bacterium]
MDINYQSLDAIKERLNFTDAVIQGQSTAKGLFFPEHIPTLSEGQIQHLLKLPREQRAFHLLRPFVDATINDEALLNACTLITSFPIPLRWLTDDVAILELFHGPTLAFKDVGARFVAAILDSINQKSPQPRTVLVATSGDTGGAVAAAFENASNTKVIILYPRGGVSRLQELQLTSNGHSVFAIEVDGDFDVCQAMVKTMFADQIIKDQFGLISANSINIARWLPQQIYYFDALSQWHHDTPPVIAVPSGNFGNIAAGLIAVAQGLPVQGMIAACNNNDTVPRFMQTGEWQPRPTQSTLSNAMDISVPSNYPRVVELLEKHMNTEKFVFQSVQISDDSTAEKIKQCLEQYDYWIDPHTAVGLSALDKLISKKQKAICLSTAHPIKFAPTVSAITGATPPLDIDLEQMLLAKSQRKFQMNPSTTELIAFMRTHLT